MNVLLVDDEPNVLAGLERALLALLPEDWNVRCARDGATALAELADVPCEIVVSDMRMPAMDGAELLHRVAERWPTTARVVLSGHADEALAMRAAAVAHQSLAKPCDARQLAATLERLAGLSRDADGAVRALVGGLNRLPLLPRVFRELVHVLQRDDADARAVAQIVRKDPAISAKLLQLVNSAFFCRGNRTTDLVAAITRLGTRTVKNVALSEAILGDTAPPARFGLRAQSERCLAASIVVERLAPVAQRDDATLTALLCNVGLCVVAGAAPDALDRALAAAEGGAPLVDAERITYATTHAELGGYLLGLWGLPAAIASAVGGHHAITDDADPVLRAAAHVAAHHAEGVELDDAVLDAVGWVADDVRAALDEASAS